MKVKACLLIIDVQNDFITGALSLSACPSKHDGSQVVPVINRLRDHFDCVCLSHDWHPPEHCSFLENIQSGKVQVKETDPAAIAPLNLITLLANNGIPEHQQVIWPTHCVQGSHGAEVHKDLIVKDSDMNIRKGMQQNVDSYSAFFDNGDKSWRKDTGLTQMLRNAGVTDVYCVGIAYDVCVFNTAMHAAEMGFATYLVDPACRSVDAVATEDRKVDMKAAGIHILMSEQETLDTLQHQSRSLQLVADDKKKALTQQIVPSRFDRGCCGF